LALRYHNTLIIIFLITSFSFYSQEGVKIAPTIGTPDPSALLDIENGVDKKGILITRVSLTNRTITNPINTPANSLLVFNTNFTGTNFNDVQPGYYYWDTDSTKWIRLLTTASSDNQNIDSLTLVDANLSIFIEDGDSSSIDLSPLKDHDWYEIGLNESADNINDTIYTLGHVGIGTNSPSTTLDIQGTHKQIRIGNNNEAGYIEISRGDGNYTGGLGYETATENNILELRNSSGGAEINVITNTGVGTSGGFNVQSVGTAATHMTVRNTGRVGLSTINPTHTLDVNGEARVRVVNDTLEVANLLTANTNGVIKKLAYDSLVSYLKDSIKDLDWYKSNTNTTPNDINDSIYTLGNVGIKTLNPSYSLHIDNGNLFNITNRQAAILTEGFFGGGVIMKDITPNGFSGMFMSTTGPNENKLHLSVLDNGSGNLENSHFTLNEFGEVGIGTTDPLEILHIETGNAIINADQSGLKFSAGNIMIRRNGEDLEFVELEDGANLPQSPIAGGGNVWMHFDDQGGETARIGIGTITPTDRLHVNGSVRIGITTAAGAGPVAGYGDRLYFSGGPTNPIFGSENSDLIWMARYNSGIDSTELRLNIGDNTAGHDIFNVGRVTAGVWTPTISAIISQRRVGINTETPTEALEVVGNILASGTITPSDKRFKENISIIDSALLKLHQLNGVTYTMKEEFKSKGFEDRVQIGVIAQEVEAIYPQLVKTNPETGYKGVDYSKFTPILIEAIKELDKQVQNLKSENNSLKSQLDERDVMEKRLQSQIDKINQSLSQ